MDFLNGETVGGNRCEIQQSDMIYMYAKVQFQTIQGRIQDFKLEGAHLKNLSRAEGATKIFGVFRVKNHDFTPKNHIFSNFRRGARAGCAPWIRPCYPIHSCKGPTI